VLVEDLGTVPEGFHERMAAANILSYRVLFFEQEPDTGGILPPNVYPALALAVVGSHDLPRLRGWWEGRDLKLKEQLGLFPGPSEALRQREARERDRMQLLDALRREGLLAPDGEPDSPTLARAAHVFLARTCSVIAMAQIDDLTDEADPVNIPATFDEHPNWRRRMSMTLEELEARRRFDDIAAIPGRARLGKTLVTPTKMLDGDNSDTMGDLASEFQQGASVCGTPRRSLLPSGLRPLRPLLGRG
jgi:4-alpha-glucanotransferase